METNQKWYGVKLLFERILSGSPNQKLNESEEEAGLKLFEESIILVHANLLEHVQSLVKEKYATALEAEYLNSCGQTVTWSFVQILDIYELTEEHIQSGTEVYSRFIHENEDVSKEEMINRYFPEAKD